VTGSVFDALARCFLATARGFDHPDLVAGERPGFIYAAIGSQIGPFNRLMFGRAGAAPTTLEVDGPLAELEGFPTLTAWIPTVGDWTALEAHLAARGFVADDELPAMMAPLDALPEPVVPAGATWSMAAGPAGLAGVVEALCAGFGIPDDLRSFIAGVVDGIGRSPDGPLRQFLAVVDGRPAATALGVLCGETLAVYNVATIPDFRGRGLGRLVTLAAMRDGAVRGARTAVLESSEDGYSVYERLGFREVGRYRVLGRRR
jgi:ribosomal protein S18 acetylase RimI-like enzyme